MILKILLTIYIVSVMLVARKYKERKIFFISSLSNSLWFIGLLILVNNWIVFGIALLISSACLATVLYRRHKKKQNNIPTNEME